MWIRSHRSREFVDQQLKDAFLKAYYGAELVNDTII